MNIVVMNKNNYNTVQLLALGISFSETTFTVTTSGGSYTYTYEDYVLQILWR